MLGLVFVASLGFGASYEDGVEAYKNRDFKTALPILKNFQKRK